MKDIIRINVSVVFDHYYCVKMNLHSLGVARGYYRGGLLSRVFVLYSWLKHYQTMDQLKLTSNDFLKIKSITYGLSILCALSVYDID